MASEAVKLAKLARDQKNLDMLVSLLTHPVYSVVLAFVLIEVLQSQKVMGTVAGTVLETGLVAQPVLTSLANSGIVESLGNAAPALLPLLIKAIPVK